MMMQKFYWRSLHYVCIVSVFIASLDVGIDCFYLDFQRENPQRLQIVYIKVNDLRRNAVILFFTFLKFFWIKKPHSPNILASQFTLILLQFSTILIYFKYTR